MTVRSEVEDSDPEKKQPEFLSYSEWQLSEATEDEKFDTIFEKLNVIIEQVNHNQSKTEKNFKTIKWIKKQLGL